MKQINPSCKLIGLLVVTFVIAFVHHPVLSMIVFAATAVLILTSGADPKAYLLPMIPIVILAIGMFFTGYRFTNPDVHATVVNLSNIGLWSAAMVSSPESGYTVVMLIKYIFYLVNSINGLRIWLRLSRKS